MNKIIIAIITIAGVGILAWAGASFIKSSSPKNDLEKTPQNYQEAVSAEGKDKCATPEGYTKKDWERHMSHHPDRYSECFKDEESAKQKFNNIDPQDLALMLEQTDPTLIDVHVPEQPHIKGTDMLMPYNEIDPSKLPADKQEAIVLYCRSGSMSKQAATELMEMGYTNVYHLVGGLNAWQAAGYETTIKLDRYED